MLFPPTRPAPTPGQPYRKLDKQTFFEATVSAGPFVAKADILRRQNVGWHVLEVKSSFSDTGSINELIDDLAYTVMVFRRAGFSVAKASLVLLSRGYRFGDSPDRGLYERQNRKSSAAIALAQMQSDECR